MKSIIMITILVLSVAPVLADAQDAERGRALFTRKCKGCHRLTDGVKVGPGLAGVTSRRTERWIHKWLQNPRKMIADGDETAVTLKKKYKKTMRTIKLMKDERNRKDIIAFLKQNDKEQEKK